MKTYVGQRFAHHYQNMQSDHFFFGEQNNKTEFLP